MGVPGGTLIDILDEISANPARASLAWRSCAIAASGLSVGICL
jgi:hypothetical protein